MQASVSKRRPGGLISLVVLALGLALIGVAGTKPAAAAGSAVGFTSFSAWISSANIWTYTNPNRLDVRGYASYRDYDCSPSYQCDRNVLAVFELRRGYSNYSPLVTRAYDQTGQYSSTVDASFQIPSCRLIDRFRSQPYTIVMTAAAPDGRQKTSSRTVYQRSCR
jgi:hypothetical protein